MTWNDLEKSGVNNKTQQATENEIEKTIDGVSLSGFCGSYLVYRDYLFLSNCRRLRTALNQRKVHVLVQIAIVIPPITLLLIHIRTSLPAFRVAVCVIVSLTVSVVLFEVTATGLPGRSGLPGAIFNLRTIFLVGVIPHMRLIPSFASAATIPARITLEFREALVSTVIPEPFL